MLSVAPSTTTYVALLRGINLGKARQVPMPRLAEILTARGHGDVRTHLRSGNVVLTSALSEEKLAADISAAVQEEFGFDTPVVVRTGEELAAVVAGNPFAGVATDPARYLVTFMATTPDRQRLAKLPEPEDDSRYEIRGRELYLWLPDGMHAAAMAKWPWDRLLGVAGTNRNWNTVTKLAELAA